MWSLSCMEVEIRVLGSDGPILCLHVSKRRTQEKKKDKQKRREKLFCPLCKVYRHPCFRWIKLCSRCFNSNCQKKFLVDLFCPANSGSAVCIKYGQCLQHPFSFATSAGAIWRNLFREDQGDINGCQWLWSSGAIFLHLLLVYCDNISKYSNETGWKTKIM